MRRAARSKYGNIATVVDGIRFASKREARRWQDLRLLEKAGEIRNLMRQVRYPLTVNGIRITTYIADYVYVPLNRISKEWEFNDVVEDVKGVRTPVYKLKRALMFAIHGIKIVET